MVSPAKPLHEELGEDIVEFDASPWGGGAARRRGQSYVDWCSVAWEPWMLGRTGAEIGQPKSQSFFEFLSLFLVLLVWGSTCSDTVLQILGDNTDAL